MKHPNQPVTCVVYLNGEEIKRMVVNRAVYTAKNTGEQYVQDQYKRKYPVKDGCYALHYHSVKITRPDFS